MSVYGFEGAYAPGNGDYIQFALANGRPAYKRNSATQATNWRIYYTGSLWMIGNEVGFKSNSSGGFSSVNSTAALPFEVQKPWSNPATGVQEVLVSAGLGRNIRCAENECAKDAVGGWCDKV